MIVGQILYLSWAKLASENVGLLKVTLGQLWTILARLKLSCADFRLFSNLNLECILGYLAFRQKISENLTRPGRGPANFKDF